MGNLTSVDEVLFSDCVGDAAAGGLAGVLEAAGGHVTKEQQQRLQELASGGAREPHFHHDGSLESRKRLAVDLLRAERVYVQDLAVLIHTFYLPLLAWVDEVEALWVQDDDLHFIDERSSRGGSIPWTDDQGHSDLDFPLREHQAVTRRELAAVFCNVEQIAAFHKQFLKDLEGAYVLGGVNAVLEPILRASPFLTIYGTYVRNAARARDTLAALEARPAFATFIKACELQRAARGQRLREYLLLPVRRLPRYRRLLEATKRRVRTIVDREGGTVGPAAASISGLVRELRELEAVVDEVHAEAHRAARRDRELALRYRFPGGWGMGQRALVKEGTLTKICASGPQQFQFALFHDLLAYGSGTCTGLNSRTQHKMTRCVDLSTAYLVDTLPKRQIVPLGQEEAAFMLLSTDRSLVVVAEDAVEKAEWVAAVRGAMAALRANKMPEPSYSGNLGAHAHRASALFRAHIMAKGTKKRRAEAAAAAAQAAERHKQSAAKRVCSLWSQGIDSVTKRVAYRLPKSASVRVTCQSVMGSPRQRALFRQHLEECHCEENLDFVEAVTRYNEAAAGDMRQRVMAMALANAIINRFIADDAPQQLNMSERTRDEVCAAVAAARCSPSLFDTALLEARGILETDSFLKFKTSGFFPELVSFAQPHAGPPAVLAFDDLDPVPPPDSVCSTPEGTPAHSPPPSPLAEAAEDDGASGGGGGAVSNCSTPRGAWSPPPCAGADGGGSGGVRSSGGGADASAPSSVEGSCCGDGGHVLSAPLSETPTASPGGGGGGGSDSAGGPYVCGGGRAPLSPRLALAALAAIPDSGGPADAWEMGPRGPLRPSHLGPGPHRVRVVAVPGPEGLGLNLERGARGGGAVVRGFRQLGRGLLNPAQEAGLLPGDVLLECDGYLCGAFGTAVARLRGATEGVPLELVVRRGGAPMR
ncbi:hypothetical protein JKP88DRAFT_263693 [Tribonema minus]|uniref:DH domain-containing protein n=1 Tax=Tribonema minus TaxID=303371 RepID=A0A835YSS4_9STRA|nr:hypothetical protein JKP88DRAFT_263693 [Tribonema minus]